MFRIVDKLVWKASLPLQRYYRPIAWHSILCLNKYCSYRIASLLPGVPIELEVIFEVDAGHFALDTKADEIAAMVHQFVSAHVAEKQ